MKKGGGGEKKWREPKNDFFASMCPMSVPDTLSALIIRPRPRRSLAQESFNGAAAVRPQKAVLSSLRSPPRLDFQWGRGGEAAERKPPIIMVTRPTGRLQWGRGGEAAERIQEAAVITKRNKLQWGRGGEAAESPESGAMTVASEPASMGPRR